MEIYTAPSPHEAKNIAKQHYREKRDDWDQIKVQIMKEIVTSKASQHPEVQKALINSKDKEIVEDSPYDSFWGIGKDGKGQNMLGKLWMEIREELLLV